MSGGPSLNIEDVNIASGSNCHSCSRCDNSKEIIARVRKENVQLTNQLVAYKVREGELLEQILQLEGEFSKEVTESLRLARELQELREKMKMLTGKHLVFEEKKLKREIYQLRLSQRSLKLTLEEKTEKEREWERKNKQHMLECEQLEDVIMDLRQQLSLCRSRRRSVPEADIRRGTLDTDPSTFSLASRRKRRCKSISEDIMLLRYIKLANQDCEFASTNDTVQRAKSKSEKPARSKAVRDGKLRVSSLRKIPSVVECYNFPFTKDTASSSDEVYENVVVDSESQSLWRNENEHKQYRDTQLSDTNFSSGSSDTSVRVNSSEVMLLSRSDRPVFSSENTDTSSFKFDSMHSCREVYDDCLEKSKKLNVSSFVLDDRKLRAYSSAFVL